MRTLSNHIVCRSSAKTQISSVGESHISNQHPSQTSCKNKSLLDPIFKQLGWISKANTRMCSLGASHSTKDL